MIKSLLTALLLGDFWHGQHRLHWLSKSGQDPTLYSLSSCLRMESKSRRCSGVVFG